MTGKHQLRNCLNQTDPQAYLWGLPGLLIDPEGSRPLWRCHARQLGSGFYKIRTLVTAAPPWLPPRILALLCLSDGLWPTAIHQLNPSLHSGFQSEWFTTAVECNQNTLFSASCKYFARIVKLYQSKFSGFVCPIVHEASWLDPLFWRPIPPH